MAFHHHCRILLVLVFVLVAYSNLSPIQCKSRENADRKNVKNTSEQQNTDEYMHEQSYALDDGDLEDGGEVYYEDEEEEDEGDDDDFDERDVIVLGSGNFSSFVGEHRAVFVVFHAPWCLHCAKLGPQWAAAATALKGRKEEVVLAKVDDSAHGDVGEKLHVHRFPTLMFFLDGVHSSYNGNRSTDAIVKYVTTKLSRSVRALMSVSDADSLLEVQSPIAIAYLKKLKGPEVFELGVVARQQEDVAFYMTSSEDVAARLGFHRKPKPQLALLRNVNVSSEELAIFKGVFKRKPLHEFVSANKLPLVIFYNRETTSLFFENALHKQVLCFVRDDEYWGYARPLFEEAARAFRGQALFVRVRLNDQIGGKVAEFYGITGENPIVIMAVAVGGDDAPKYLYDGEFTVPGIKGFVQGFMVNKLRPYFKSQPLPPPSTEDVKTAVSRNFDELVLDEAKDTLLELYSPWCHHCQDVEPIYRKLAKVMKSIPSVSVVKMDGVANEHPRAKVDEFPTILLYPANRKKFEPIKFGGDISSVKSLYQFLKKHAAIPFALPKRVVTSEDPKLKDEL